MKICRMCKGNCDNGELIGGICPERREAEAREQERADDVARMLRSPFYQMAPDMEPGV